MKSLTDVLRVDTASFAMLRTEGLTGSEAGSALVVKPKCCRYKRNAALNHRATTILPVDTSLCLLLTQTPDGSSATRKCYECKPVLLYCNQLPLAEHVPSGSVSGVKFTPTKLPE